jgi:hypothetical protein
MNKKTLVPSKERFSESQWDALRNMASPELQKLMQRGASIEEEEDFGRVIDDSVKFSTSLGFKSTDELLGSGLFGILSGVAVGIAVGGALTASAAATASALTAAAVSNLGVLGTIGVSLGLIAAPVVAPVAVPIAIPIAAGVGGAAVVGSLSYFIKTKGKKFSTYGGYKSFNTNIDRLGHSIAGKIFVPIIGLIKESGSSNYNYDREKMAKWGYAEVFVEGFIASISNMDIVHIKKSIGNYNSWLKKQMKKQMKKLNKKDIDMNVLYAKIIELAEDVGGSEVFLEFIKENCK